MGNNRIKKIDSVNEIPVTIVPVKNKETDIAFNQKVIVVENANSSYGYILLCLEILMEEHLLEYEEVLLFLYLQELGLFELKIKLRERNMDLSMYLRMGYLQENYSHKKNRLFNLSEKGLCVVNDFVKIINNRDSFISENRKTEINLENKVKSVLGNYFDK